MSTIHNFSVGPFCFKCPSLALQYLRPAILFIMPIEILLLFNKAPPSSTNDQTAVGEGLQKCYVEYWTNRVFSTFTNSDIWFNFDESLLLWTDINYVAIFNKMSTLSRINHLSLYQSYNLRFFIRCFWSRKM